LERIVIIGATGSGKSTLAAALAAKLRLPFTDLDDLYWQPGWIETPPADFRAAVDAATSAPQWIIAGNYSAVRDLTWGRADTLIWLDYGFPRVLWQLLRRSVRRVCDRTLICNGNRETLGKLLSRDSIVVWLFTSFAKRRRDHAAIFNDSRPYPGIKTLIRLKNPEQARHLLLN
jgi:adenylate kinase family enzyme